MSCVTLIGMPGSGKSTVGVLLAKALGFDFLDTDLLLQRREGMYLQDILERRGIEAFLDAEEAAVLYLRVPLPELERRVNNITTRGIAMAPGQTLGDVYAQRAPLYEQYAGAVVEVAPRAALENTVAAVCVRLNELDLTDIP